MVVDNKFRVPVTIPSKKDPGTIQWEGIWISEPIETL